jgi:hypothetical protein
MLGGWIGILQRRDESSTTRRDYFHSNQVATSVNRLTLIVTCLSGERQTSFTARYVGPGPLRG